MGIPLRRDTLVLPDWKLTRILRCMLLSAGLAATGCFAQETGKVTLHADFWADNWFALYAGEQLVFEDSVAYLTERSFNAESFEFDIALPATLSLIVKDYKADDTGLEYIGTRRQQMGDGGFIGQFFDSSKQLQGVSSANWRCITIHQAPLNPSCERDANPSTTCESLSTDTPADWSDANFDDSEWPYAVEHSSAAVRPHGGYRDIDWHADAKLIWTDDLEIDNTILCRFTLDAH